MPDKKSIKQSAGHQLVTYLTAGLLGSGLYTVDFFDYVANQYIESNPVVMKSMYLKERVDVLTVACQGEFETTVLNDQVYYFNNKGVAHIEIDACLYQVFEDAGRDKVYYMDYTGKKIELK